MRILSSFSEVDDFSQHFLELKIIRNLQKKKQVRKYRLSKTDKELILQKTNYKCHVCGGDVSISDFAADHVQPHSSSANSAIDNFLPACKICNRDRWFYSPEEIKIILKLGIWLRTQIETKTAVGKKAAEKFLIYEGKQKDR